MSELPRAAEPLAALQPTKDFFIGLDSDGCVFDSMEIKHKECFIPNIIKYWELQAISKFAREASEFVNLYSRWRGTNRWPALVITFDLLRNRPEVLRRGTKVSEISQVRAFVESGYPQSNGGLEAFMAAEGSHEELVLGLEWSRAVNAAVEDMVHGVTPFPFVRESLERLRESADIVVVSGTPTGALRREWDEHDIDQYVRLIAGQEMGKKSLHLSLAAGGKYPSHHQLMIGDSPGDLKAANSTGAAFFPVNPGHEEASWQQFYEEGIDKFLSGSYSGAYQEALINEFLSLLPEKPPWES
jgi:phosphoglycolate phosphatase-like HAD superfamily hydrolase